MKKLISLFVEGFRNNECFLEENIWHKFMPTDGYRVLREAFEEKGYELNTSDVNFGRSVCAEIYIEGQLLSHEHNVPRFLLAYENPIINPLNSDPAYYERFSRVFTWNPEMLQVGNVEILMVPQVFKVRDFRPFEERTDFMALINANKAFKDQIPGDLYKARLDLIRYCEQSCPELFSLYGRGWDKPTLSYRRGAKIKRSWDRFKTKAFGHRPFPSYKGEVADKDTVYQNTRFAICYENFSGLSHYITEKIFDAFFSGCVPVYLGAPDINDFIPCDTFVDRRNFDSDRSLIEFLGSISKSEYDQYQAAIRRFLVSPEAIAFDLRFHTEKVVSSCSKVLS